MEGKHVALHTQWKGDWGGGGQSAPQVQLVHHHVQDMPVVLEEGNQPLPRCSKYNMFVPCGELNNKHQAVTMCANGV